MIDITNKDYSINYCFQIHWSRIELQVLVGFIDHRKEQMWILTENYKSVMIDYKKWWLCPMRNEKQVETSNKVQPLEI